MAQLALRARWTTSRATRGTTAHPPRMGFFTDTSVCIGCKACEVACKEWNEVPDDGYVLTGMSYDNTQALGASTWRHVAFVEKPLDEPLTTTDLGLPGMGPPGAMAGRGPGRRIRRRRRALADVVGRLQALHPRRLPRRVPDRLAVPHRVRHRRRPARHLQRLRLLRAGLPLRRDRPAQGGRPGLQVHAVLRPAQGGRDARPAPRPARPSRSSSASSSELRERADRAGRASCTRRASTSPGSTARDPEDGVGGDGAFFLLLDEPEVYGLPPDPVVTTRDLGSIWKHVGAAAATLAGARRRVVPREAPMSPEGRRRPGRPPMVPEAEFESYYGRQIIKTPTWKTPDVPLYLFLGGMAGGSALLAEGAALAGPAGAGAGRPRCAAAGAGARHRRPGPRPRAARAVPQHAARLQADLAAVGRVVHPGAVLGVLRAAAARRSPAGSRAWAGSRGVGAAAFGPPLATYTAALFANTAVPAWHEAHRELPFVFAGSGAAAAGGLAMVLAPGRRRPGRRVRMALAGAALEIGAAEVDEPGGWAWSPSPTSRAGPARLMRPRGR